MRGTFANIRLRNRLTPDAEGNVTEHLPSGERMSIFDAAMRYAEEGTPLIILAGKEYGSGASRDWAAKGPLLQGVRAVIAESYERIHRSNLVGMGILPLQYLPGRVVGSSGLTGRETFKIGGLVGWPAAATGGQRHGSRRGRPGDPVPRGGSPGRRDRCHVLRNGGVLQTVLRRLATEGSRLTKPAHARRRCRTGAMGLDSAARISPISQGVPPTS